MTGYADAYPLYLEKGWPALLPLQRGKKWSPPSNSTGYEGRYPTREQMDAWAAAMPDGNIALRLPGTHVGIDVDHYGAKRGGLTLAEAQKLWGELPPSYTATSRDDGVSGIRLYRIHEGVKLAGKIEFPELGLGDIEIVQHHHRYVMCWPSIHPEGGTYVWRDPAWSVMERPPSLEDIPELPEAWVEALKESAKTKSKARTRSTEGPQWAECPYVIESCLTDGEMSEKVARRLGEAAANCFGPSRHDHILGDCLALLRYGKRGESGVFKALGTLGQAFVNGVTLDGSRTQAMAMNEFLRMINSEAAERLLSQGDDEPPTAEQHEQPSWGRVNLHDLVTGTCEVLQPTLLGRSDGVFLLYPGMVHSLHGESESGKSLLIQAECIRLINAGHDVLYLDFDSDAKSVVARLVEFGAAAELIEKHFDYRCPEVKPTSPAEVAEWDQILARSYTLAVIDGMTDALGTYGYKINENDDIANWMRAVAKKIAARTEAAVVLIDHVTKDPAGRGRWAIGGQAKMAGLTGAAYTLEVASPLGRGLRGELVLRLGKDRPGCLRDACGQFFRKDRTQEAARITVDATTAPPVVTIAPPQDASAAPFRPTHLMQRLSDVIEQQPGLLTRTHAAGQVIGKKEHKLRAVNLLVIEKWVEGRKGPGRHEVLWSIRPYREADDNPSGRGNRWGSFTGSDGVPGTGSPIGGEPGNRSGDGSGEPVGNRWEPGTTEPEINPTNQPAHWPSGPLSGLTPDEIHR